MKQNEITDFGEIRLANRRPIPIIFFLDTSGSMAGEKIDKLNEGFRKFIQNSRENQNRQQAEFIISVITFGGDEPKIYFENKKLVEIDIQNLENFKANGLTPLGKALEIGCQVLDRFYNNYKQA